MTQYSVKEMKKKYEEGDLSFLARALPHVRSRSSKSPFISFLLNSRLLTMGDHLKDPKITLGADPEFILHEKGRPEKIVLFSSRWVPDYFGISEAEVGADYGLLEFRPQYSTDSGKLVKEISSLYKKFSKDYPEFSIFEKEAIEFNHKKARVKEALELEKDINYGMGRGKDMAVWAPSSGNNVAGQELLLGQETGTTISAYDKPTFPEKNDNLFTAGGHIHLGGSYIMMLSMDQLRAFVRKLDERVLPICEAVETEAGTLRRTVYGEKGEFRTKEYGIEYRSPSNAIFFPKNLNKLQEVLDLTVDILKNMPFE